MKLIITLLLSISLTFAVEPIKQGTPAPHDGYIVSKKFVELATNNDQKIRLQELKIDRLKALDAVQEDRVALMRKRAERAEFKSTWSGIGGFVLGVVITGLIGYGAVRVSR